MHRRTFDILISATGLLLAVVLFVFGMYFYGRYDFANSTVEDQLTAQQITFPPQGPGLPENLNKYAGQLVDNGEKAEAYANDFIGLHLQETGDNEELWGLTYAELGGLERADPPPDNLEEITEVRETVFKGETLRGLLLTTYGFWQFGQEARMAMVVSFIAAGLLLLFSILGFVHAFRTPKEKTI